MPDWHINWHMDHRTLIEVLGHRRVANALGVRDNAVSHWKSRGIPPFYWPDIVSMAAEADCPVDIETLRSGRQMKRHRSENPKI